ncbi:MAG: hypothetical protein JNL39_03435, partial [Opitutaceae bacterium]|nr:hypothetical protein [Opitutaceae bacterium]
SGEARAAALYVGKGDTLRLRVRLVRQSPGTREPLVVTGRTGAGELLALEHLAAGEIRFVLDSWGQPLRASRPVRVEYERPHEIDVTLGALVTVDDATVLRGAHAGPLRVKVNGAVVWEERSDYHVAEHAEVYVGRNPIGGTSCGLRFSGEILSAERVARE